VAQLSTLGLMRIGRKILIWLILLYLVTWIGGCVSHSAALKNDAQRRYDAARKSDVEYAARAAKEGQPSPSPQASKTGPVTNVSWCFPILPGILIADSYYVVGPLYGQGGIKIVIFYGFGSWASSPFWGWIS
jgi:hypothetical protein